MYQQCNQQDKKIKQESHKHKRQFMASIMIKDERKFNIGRREDKMPFYLLKYQRIGGNKKNRTPLDGNAIKYTIYIYMEQKDTQSEKPCTQ